MGAVYKGSATILIAASLASHRKYRVSLKSDHESTPVFAEASGKLGIALFGLISHVSCV
jgi:hypothetical protein